MKLRTNRNQRTGEGRRPLECGDKSPHSTRRRERGSAVLVVLAVLTLITLYVLSNTLVLHHLKADLKLVEKQQLKKFQPAK